MSELKVRFLESTMVSPDGIHTKSAVKGQVMGLSTLVAEGLVRDKKATLVSKDEPPTPPVPKLTKVEADRLAELQAKHALAVAEKEELEALVRKRDHKD